MASKCQTGPIFNIHALKQRMIVKCYPFLIPICYIITVNATPLKADFHAFKISTSVTQATDLSFTNVIYLFILAHQCHVTSWNDGLSVEYNSNSSLNV
jgi:hypothetical protein